MHTYLMADTASGVQVIDLTLIDLIDFLDAEILGFGTFRESLKSLDDGEVIFTCADPEQLSAIEAEYGIR